YTITAVVEAAATVAAMHCAARLARLREWWLLALAALAQPVAYHIWLNVQPAPLDALTWAAFALFWTRGRREWAATWLLLGLAGIAVAARQPQKEEAQRARLVAVALSGGMLASFHMHIQELPGLFVLLAACVAAGWLPRARLLHAALALVALLWLIYVPATGY